MYICVCKGITDSHIKEAVAEGATTLRAVRMQLGAASQCGRCAEATCAVIKEAKDEIQSQVALSQTSFGGCSVVAYAAPIESI